MEINSFRKNYKLILLVLALLFFAVSIVVHTQSHLLLYRSIRGIICISFLGLMLILVGKKIQPLLSLFLLFYGVSSFATIWYENNVVATLAMGLNLISYIFLIAAVLPKVNFRKMNALLAVVFILLVLLNAYLLYEFIEMIKDFTLSNGHYLIMLVGAMSLVLLGFLALLYNYIYSTRATLIFTFFVMAIIFCEIFRATAYYEFAYGDIAVYTARALLLLGLSLLIHYEMADKKENEQLYSGFTRTKLEDIN